MACWVRAALSQESHSSAILTFPTNAATGGSILCLTGKVQASADLLCSRDAKGLKEAVHVTVNSADGKAPGGRIK